MSARLIELVHASRAVADTSSRLEKIGRIATLLRALGPADVAIAVPYLSGDLPQGRIGVGYAALQELPDDSADAPALTLEDVDTALTTIAGVGGRGSAAERSGLLSALFTRATREEQHFLVRLISGELRQGALEGVMIDAVARGAGVPVTRVRRALMLSGDLAAVARAAFGEGEAALARFGIRIFRPLSPMLAQSADAVEDAVALLGDAALEYKLDGARVQLHKSGDEVRVFTRSLKDVTGSVPELVEAAQALQVREIVLDGEAISLRPDGSPLPFQTTMRRFGRKLDVAALRKELPLAGLYFDCLYLDGDSLVDETAETRFAALTDALPEAARVPRIVTSSPEEAAGFLRAARGLGHEGIVAKALGAPYDAGRRGRSWIKVKPSNTLDLVILAAEWGHGRRKGWLSNLHLGARDPDAGGFVMLGKTFKGLTDEMLAWQTEALQRIEIARDGHTVYVQPELVAEVAFNEIQTSPRYPGGLALRFARIKSWRSDKRPADADTIATVRAIFERQTGPPTSGVES